MKKLICFFILLSSTLMLNAMEPQVDPDPLKKEYVIFAYCSNLQNKTNNQKTPVYGKQSNDKICFGLITPNETLACLSYGVEHFLGTIAMLFKCDILCSLRCPYTLESID